MTRPTLQQQLAAAELKANRLRKQISDDRRAFETRRKIVIGGTVLAAMADDDGFRTKMLALLRENVTRPLDLEVIAELLDGTPASSPANGRGQNPAPAAEAHMAE